MSVTHVVGVDPGLVHTGVVRMVFDPDRRKIWTEHLAVPGPDARAVALWAYGRGSNLPRWCPVHTMPTTFIEAYRPRSAFNTDKRMVEAVAEMRKVTKGTVLDNTGVKKIVTRELMELLRVWKFTTVTNHQDLRSAARIGLLGMLKDEAMNHVLADVVAAHLAGDDWEVSVS